MKKLFLFLFVLLVIFTSNYAKASKIDLQPRNVYYNDYSGGQFPSLFIGVQNNGPDDFEGSFRITINLRGVSDAIYANFSGSILSGTYGEISVYAPNIVSYVVIDSKNEVIEENEGNNSLFCEVPQVSIITFSSGIIARNYRNTRYVLPGEAFYENLSLADLTNKNSIIGFELEVNGYNFPEDNGVHVYFSPYHYTGESDGGKYNFTSSVDDQNYYNRFQATFRWMANSSSAAKNYFDLGYYSGSTKGMAVGSKAEIQLGVSLALKDLVGYYDGMTRIIEAGDRLRGDVNDDGVVNNDDLNLLIDAVQNGLYNPRISIRDMYKKEGLNYAAGIVLFERPDFLSNCLINIWLHDNNDPIVQGLGIGEMMSKTTPGTKSAKITNVPNSYSISNNQMIIDAPGANIYNVTANLKDGKIFQATGEIGQKIIVPVEALDYRVETVKVSQNLTAVKTLMNKESISVYPNPFTDELIINGVSGQTVKIINMRGQIIYQSSRFVNENQLQIGSNTWPKGVYVVNLNSKAGASQSIKIVK